MFGRKKDPQEDHPRDPHGKHPERNAWLEDRAAHGGDPPLLPDGTLPLPAEHHVDPQVINKDTRFAPHRSPGERVE